MPSKLPLCLFVGAFTSSLSLNPAIAASNLSGTATYVRADSQNRTMNGDIIELVREVAGREGSENGKSGTGKLKNGERRMQEEMKRRGTEEMKRRGTESTPSKKGPRGTPEGRTPAPEEPVTPEDMPKPDTGGFE
ncbi:hypothetical protein [Methylocaldum szegediense]|uniref:Uncharacterized protein n=1 Tax=Methylocaldum szegediense TaxID=73780 RepID=A0ABM9I6V9_9GAMM|nr:hypothetical protein [Methylocaldum szegediense]CAI8928468.1 conserved exported protein of unknown function [Methylocaldum szegediense]